MSEPTIFYIVNVPVVDSETGKTKIEVLSKLPENEPQEESVTVPEPSEM